MGVKIAIGFSMQTTDQVATAPCTDPIQVRHLTLEAKLLRFRTQSDCCPAQALRITKSDPVVVHGAFKKLILLRPLDGPAGMLIVKSYRKEEQK
jgi:hypothetical protein